MIDQLREGLAVVIDIWQRLSPRVRQRCVVGGAIVAGYLFVVPVVTALIFTPQAPPSSDVPRIGTMMVERDIKSTIVFRRTSRDTGGAFVELDLLMDAGGGPGNAGAHVHPDIEEQVQVLEGTVRVRVGRTERTLPVGSRLIIPKGVAHGIRNASDTFALVRERFTPAANLDSYYVQVDRAGGFAGAGRVRLAVLSTWFDQQYPAGLPVWMTKLGAALIAPTARLAGMPTYYPPAPSSYSAATSGPFPVHEGETAARSVTE